MFKPHKIPLAEARAGDILIFKRSGPLAAVLSWLIQKIKEPNWDRWGWHLAPMISDTAFLDAQFPKVKKSTLLNYPNKEIRAYRVMEQPPSQDDIDAFVEDHIGKPYDVLIYVWTALAKLLRPGVPVPRIINNFYDCWECAYDALEYCGLDLDKSDFEYPFITDFLRYIGEIK